MKKAFAALALAGSIALIGSSPAVAARYPAIPPQAAVSDGTVGPGEQFIFSGQGPFRGERLTIRVTPGNAPAAGGANIAGGRSFSSKISIFIEAQTLSTQADSEGKFSVPVTIREAGAYVLTATSDVTGYTVGPVRVVVAAGFANGGASGSNAGGNNGVPASTSLSNSGGSLANTGADSGLVLWTLVGAGALAAGATSVVVVRRRAKTGSAA
ncbi:LPXTG cell wall anchor domain-containing protein [Pseudarthrobacter sulfonivorans]|uniref:LPXTG cell wall anchor domain-containing protein n=1 Tax=Pseudarthrobacter sulfonivorans TaxID=121292 RepID=UPI00285F4D62|nr:LPXTG cell wall anchor domain-containing protein [Pseudarthrobacter sulfonivorans]MDR6414884.1 LPXTG-motif cell wall-anchored protein [Pseudarthrobacter sulfonivorans]